MSTRTPIPSAIPASSPQGTLSIDLEVRAGEETPVTIYGVGAIAGDASKTTRSPVVSSVVASISEAASMTVNGSAVGERDTSGGAVQGTGVVAGAWRKGAQSAATIVGTGAATAAAPKGARPSATITGTGVLSADGDVVLRTGSPVMSAMVATISTNEIAIIAGTAVPHSTTTTPVVSTPIAAAFVQGATIEIPLVLGGTNRSVGVTLYGSAGISTMEFALSVEILSPLPNADVDRPYMVQVRGQPVGGTVEILDDLDQVIGSGVIQANGLCDIQVN